MFLITVSATAWLGTVASVLARRDIDQIAPGIFEGPAPRGAKDYCRLESLGIKTIVEMRKFYRGKIEHEQQVVAGKGFKYYHVPTGFWPLGDDSPERALCIIADPANQPVYFHCNLGQDRSGLVEALYHVRYQGWSRADAFKHMKQGEFNPLLPGLDRYFWDHSEWTTGNSLDGK